eukprot:45764_1
MSSADHSSQVVIKQGCLHRKSSILKRLKKQWIVLTKTAIYCYNKTNSKHSKEIIDDLRNIKQIIVSDTVKVSQFELVSNNPKKNSIIFIAQSTNDMNEWIKFIEQAIYNRSNNIGITSINGEELMMYDYNCNAIDPVSITCTSTEQTIIPNENAINYYQPEQISNTNQKQNNIQEVLPAYTGNDFLPKNQ